MFLNVRWHFTPYCYYSILQFLQYEYNNIQRIRFFSVFEQLYLIFIYTLILDQFTTINNFNLDLSKFIYSTYMQLIFNLNFNKFNLYTYRQGPISVRSWQKPSPELMLRILHKKILMWNINLPLTKINYKIFAFLGTYS